ncbi:MAG TPA: CAP domain-containing protein [Solirubrobacteraceae bacterium]|nr:CAP domain-containing protein [Solirubrobacteraceae bacterium]
MGSRRRTALVATVASCACIAAAVITSSIANAAACDPTTNPASDFPSTGLQWNSDQAIQTNFTNARAAEGCATPMLLPASYDSMTPQQQMLWMFNSEREARGEPDLQLDTTLMSQVALNHSREINTYGYFDHPSPINQVGIGDPLVNVQRQLVNPVFATNYFFGENLANGFATPAEATFAYMYDDSSESWGHRGAILQAGFQWIGIGITPATLGFTYTDDFESYVGFVPPGSSPPVYTPPATADTNPPSIASVSYSGGTATATGVADSPLNVNDTGANPTTAGVTGVVFYVNNIVENPGQTFNTVPATQTAPGSGTWTAQITVNPGDVLHAVAVDGSGNFVDVTPPPPAVALAAGANSVALPAAPATASASSVASDAAATPLATTPTAAALVASIDKQAHAKVVRFVRVYRSGRWVTYTPGRTPSFPLYANEGVVVELAAAVHWHPTSHRQRFAPMRVHLHKGWNFVAVPYPYTGMTCHSVRLELAKAGDRLEQITVGPATNKGMIMRPEHGSWGNDKTMKIADSEGFWIKDAGATTWSPSPTAYSLASVAVK